MYVYVSIFVCLLTHAACIVTSVSSYYPYIPADSPVKALRRRNITLTTPRMLMF